jgi:lipopolysaccharide biosynthesis regulator YciM
MIGEGLVGTCFKEKNTLLVDDVPDSYTVRSGLGQSRLNTLLFVPILQDELHEGVVEIGLYQNVEKYKIEFVERLAHNLAATFANRKATERIQVMLQESNEKAEQIRSSEEELRQTIEEMEATKEAAAEREKKLMKEIEELKTQIGD